MKTALSITFLIAVLCLSATAGPISSLPPLLPPPVVKRPAPLLSPSHAGAVKNKPMARVTKATTFTPASVTKSGCTVINDFNWFHCDTNDPTCILYDVIHVTMVALAGPAATIEMSEDLRDWMWVAQYGAATFDRDVEFEWNPPSSQRVPQRFFRLVATPVSDFSAASGEIRRNPNFKGLRAWSRPRK